MQDDQYEPVHRGERSARDHDNSRGTCVVCAYPGKHARRDDDVTGVPV